MNEFMFGEQLRYLPCMHTYHKECIDDWLMRSFTCPSCMEPVDAALLTTYQTSWSQDWIPICWTIFLYRHRLWQKRHFLQIVVVGSLKLSLTADRGREEKDLLEKVRCFICPLDSVSKLNVSFMYRLGDFYPKFHVEREKMVDIDFFLLWFFSLTFF